ncbi:MAG TPA: hypothetical protein VG892_09295 [Terriglobales bacterium]|nr:hypothetical protein [Terriglobales bacterium]
MNDLSTPALNMLERYLDLTTQRQSLVVTNMANIDTPGYQTRDLNFKAELQRAVSNNETSTSAMTFSPPGLLQRPDGNNVNIDRESMLMAEMQMQFRLGVQLVRNEFSRLYTAINEGSKG